MSKRRHHDLKEHLELLRQVDKKIAIVESIQSRGNGPSQFTERLSNEIRDMIQQETQQRNEIERALHRLGDPIRAGILWLYYTQGLTADEIAAMLVPADETGEDLKPTIERLLAEGVAAFDRLHR